MTEPVADLEQRLQRALGHAAAQITAHPSAWQGRERSMRQRSKGWPSSFGTLADYALIAISIAVSVAIFVGAILLVAHRTPVTSAPPRPGAAWERQPTFASEKALVGRVHSLRGTPIVILAWASWCRPCQPDLQRVLQATARHDHQVKFLLADTNDSRKRARRVLMRYELSYPIYETQVRLHDILPQPLSGLPTLILINGDGKVSYVHVGEYTSVAAIEQDITAHLLKG